MWHFASMFCSFLFTGVKHTDSLYSTHFVPGVFFYTSWKHRETSGFLRFSGGTEMEYWHEMGWELWSNGQMILLLQIIFVFLVLSFEGNFDFCRSCRPEVFCKKGVLRNLWYMDMICLRKPYPFKSFKGFFHKFYLVHSWILCPRCNDICLWLFLLKLQPLDLENLICRTSLLLYSKIKVN